MPLPFNNPRKGILSPFASHSFFFNLGITQLTITPIRFDARCASLVPWLKSCIRPLEGHVVELALVSILFKVPEMFIRFTDLGMNERDDAFQGSLVFRMLAPWA